MQRADMSGPALQLNTALKVGVMWDHNGTYMEGFGFQYKDQHIQIGLSAEDTMTGEQTACCGLRAMQPAICSAILCSHTSINSG